MVDEVIIIALVTGLVEVLKRSLGLTSKYVPIASLVIGVAMAFLVMKTGSYTDHLLVGLIYGLSASGLYSGGKSVLGK